MGKLIEQVIRFKYGSQEYATLEEAETAQAAAEAPAVDKWLSHDRRRGYGEIVSETEYGIWKVYGEDPNCDMGGYHHEPYLGTVEGTYRQAAEWAVKHRNFFGWGQGGSIKRAKVDPIIKL